MCIRLRSLTVYYPFVTKLIRYCQVSFAKHVNVLFLKQFPILKGDLLLQSKQFSLKPPNKMFCSFFQWQGFHHTKNIGDVFWAIFSTYIIIFLFTLSCHCRQKVWQWPKMCTLDRILKIHGIFFLPHRKKKSFNPLSLQSAWIFVYWTSKCPCRHLFRLEQTKTKETFGTLTVYVSCE